MGGIGRRAFLGGTAATAAGLVAARLGALPSLAAPLGALPANPFTLGVASGDPLPTRVMLWTRLAPDPLNGGGVPPGDRPVDWEVATDPGFGDVVAAGTATAPTALAHSVHVDATGLEPDSWYWYRFEADGWTSPVGRTRTLPVGDSSPASVRFGFASCQAWTSGYYTAHQHLAAEDLDLVFFLGDYIYEGGGSDVRAHNSGEIFTLDAYRNRYGLYKGDANLQASHAAFPWMVTWDDHEVDNNYADDHQENGDPPDQFLQRRAAAYQAWYEHQPVRLTPPTGPDLEIHRSFAWGDLAGFHVLDTRQYRDDQVCEVDDGVPVDEPCPDNEAPGRTMLGPAQEAWLDERLRAGNPVWDVLAQQIVMSHMPFEVGPTSFINQDQWDGYPAARRRLLDSLAANTTNPIAITGDIHASGVGDLLGAPDETPVGTELVGTSISSSFDADLIDLAEQIIGDLDWVHYVNARERGYVVVQADRDQLRADYRLVDTALEPTSGIRTATSWTVEATPVPREPGEPRPPVTESPTDTNGQATDPIAPSSGPTQPGSQSPAADPVATQPSFTG